MNNLLDVDEVASVIATSNAFGWSVDDYSIGKVDIDNNIVVAQLSFHASGDQDPDKMYCGDEIEGCATVLIDEEGCVEFEDVMASMKDER